MEFKVGTQVMSERFGHGEIIEIDDDAFYPITAVFEDQTEATFTKDGKFEEDDEESDLTVINNLNL